MSLPQLLVLAAGLIVGANIFSILQRGRRGMWKLGIKEGINSVFPILALVWFMLVILLLAVSVPAVTNWVASLKLGHENPSSDILWVYDTLPIVYNLTGLAIIVVLVTKLLKYKPFKYSEAEQTLLKQERAKRREKLAKFVPARILNLVLGKGT